VTRKKKGGTIIQKIRGHTRWKKKRKVLVEKRIGGKKLKEKASTKKKLGRLI